MIMKDVLKKIGLLLIAVLYMPVSSATQITIVNLDGASEGFNDNTVVVPVGGNTGVTIGEQRLQVFKFAAKIWGSIVNSEIEIRVEANFDPLTCTSATAVLGAAGTAAVFRDFTRVPVRNTWYPVALANSIARKDLSSLPDVRATFNSSLDNNNNCLNNTNWYYGLDANKPAFSVDLLSVVMHEIGHGLGFQTFYNTTTGEKFSGLNDVFMLNLEDHSLGLLWSQLTDSQRLNSSTDTADLHWIGSSVNSEISAFTSGVNQGHIRQYAPDSLIAGSSVSHFDSALFPDELMEPSINSTLEGPGLAVQLMQDIGWGVFQSFTPVIGAISDQSISGVSSQLEFAVRDVDTDSSRLSFSFISSNTNLINASGLTITGTGLGRTLSLTPNVGVAGTSTITLNVSDGINSSSEVFQLTVTNTPPEIVINTPVNGANFVLTDNVIFQATALDVEDGDLSSSIQWSSSIDGVIGVASQLSVSLSAGPHSITASVTDSAGVVSNASILVNVYGDSDADGMNDLWELTNFLTLNRDGTGDFDGDGINDLDEYLISVTTPDGDLNGDGIINVLDMLIAQRIINGELLITPLQLAHGDVAPLIGGIPSPDGAFNIADMLLITRKAVGEVVY